ncbi:MAG: hypothetical protein Q7V58_09375 [Actinomycetota bacterium]|nr:hypothetical protein [Actinomycetota bacterium]
MVPGHEIDYVKAHVVGLTHAVNELAAAVAILAAESPDAAEHATQAQLHLLAAELLASEARAVADRSVE